MAMPAGSSQFAAENAASGDCVGLNSCQCASPSIRPFRQVRNHRLLICSECGLVCRQARLNGAGISADQGKSLDYPGPEESPREAHGETQDRLLQR